MAIEAVLPAIAVSAVSLAGFLYARYVTAKYDRAHSETVHADQAVNAIIKINAEELEKMRSTGAQGAKGTTTIMVPVRIIAD